MEETGLTDAMKVHRYRFVINDLLSPLLATGVFFCHFSNSHICVKCQKFKKIP